MSWKRKYFFLMCILLTFLMMIKIEFSYTLLFSKNIIYFLILFEFMDMFLEQLLTRIIMQEALLVSPILGYFIYIYIYRAFIVGEFLMTLGAENFQDFIVSYFIETTLVVLSRIYLDPAVEKLEHLMQRLSIYLSLHFKCCRTLFQGILTRQLMYYIYIYIYKYVYIYIYKYVYIYI